MYEELNSKKVKTRKNHTCAWCGEKINVGEAADYRAYKYEGDFHTDYMHEECTNGMKRSMDDKELREDLIDYGFETGGQFRGGLLASREAAAWSERYSKEQPHNEGGENA